MDEVIEIQNLIYEFRGQRVMFDRDLAHMYGVETKVLNQAVKRNKERFPIDFMFQLSKNEMEIWRSQSVTSNSIKMGMRRPPYVFTENGVAMLSSILKSTVAIQVNIGIMRAFTEFRKIATALPQSSKDIVQLRKDFEELKLDIEDVLRDQNDINEMTRSHLDNIDQALALLQTQRKHDRPRPIGFNAPQENNNDNN
jgi:hypothetical protein